MAGAVRMSAAGSRTPSLKVKVADPHATDQHATDRHATDRHATDPHATNPHLSERDLDAVKLPEDLVEEAVRLARGFADPTRLRILALLRRGEVCVHQIVTALAMEQSAVSHQLRVLRQARLVTGAKRGRHVYYRLADEHVASMLEGVLSHSQEA